MADDSILAAYKQGVADSKPPAPAGPPVPAPTPRPAPFAWLIPIALASLAALAGAAVSSFKADQAYQMAKTDHDAVIRLGEILPRVERHLEKTDALLHKMQEQKGGK